MKSNPSKSITPIKLMQTNLYLSSLCPWWWSLTLHSLQYELVNEIATKTNAGPIFFYCVQTCNIKMKTRQSIQWTPDIKFISATLKKILVKNDYRTTKSKKISVKKKNFKNFFRQVCFFFQIFFEKNFFGKFF